MMRFRTLLNLGLIFIVLMVGFPAASTVFAHPSTFQSQEQQSIDLHLSNWGYEDVTLTGPYSYASYAIGLPYHWEMLPGGKLNLVINYVVGGSLTLNPTSTDNSQANKIPAASIQINLNEKTIYQTFFTSIGEQNLSIPLPDAWPKRTGDYDRLDVYLHVYGPCEYSSFGTLTISKTSLLSLKYHFSQMALDLSSYPHPFYQRTFLPNTVDMVIPENASISQASAGLAVAAGLGSLTSNKAIMNAFTNATWEQNSPFPNHIIVVGTPDQNSLITKLNELTNLPAPLRKRLYKINIAGPGSIAPGNTVTYTTQVENTEITQVDNLAVHNLVPFLAENVQCQPDCKKEPGQVTWQVGPLDPAATATYSLTFTMPEKATGKIVPVTAELAQDQKAINVSTLSSSVQAGEDVAQVHAKPASDYFFTMNNRAVPEMDGIIELFPSPWQMGKAILFVTGLTDEAINKAGIALGASNHFPGMSGQAVLIEEVLPKPIISKQEAPDISFTDLGYKDQIVQGLGRKDIYYNFDLPLSWNLSEEASVRLLFSHSPLLDSKKSSITLFFNNTPVASIALDETNAISGELVGKLPPSSARPGLQNTLLVQIEEDITDRCISPETSQAWTTISAASSLHLVHSISDVKELFNLDYWPQQFITDPSLSDVAFVLPEHPTLLEDTLAIQTASYLGASSGANYFQPILIMGKPEGIDLGKYHVITIGKSSRNSVLQSVNDALPQPFIPGTDKILQKIDNIIFRLPDDLDLGYLELVPSPWNGERAIITITGTTDQGLQDSARLLNSGENWQLNGNLALIRDEKVYTTDTKELTKAGSAGFVATVVPETTVEIIPTVTPQPTAIPTVQAVVNAINATKEAPSPTYAQRFPLLVPVVTGASLLIIVVILVIALRRPGQAR